MSSPEAPSPTQPESADSRLCRAAAEWGRLAGVGVVVGSLWRDRLGGTVQVVCLSLAGPALAAVVTVRRHDPDNPRIAVPVMSEGPFLSYPITEFCAFEELAGKSWAYRFTRILPDHEKAI